MPPCAWPLGVAPSGESGTVTAATLSSCGSSGWAACEAAGGPRGRSPGGESAEPSAASRLCRCAQSSRWTASTAAMRAAGLAPRGAARGGGGAAAGFGGRPKGPHCRTRRRIGRATVGCAAVTHISTCARCPRSARPTSHSQLLHAGCRPISFLARYCAGRGAPMRGEQHQPHLHVGPAGPQCAWQQAQQLLNTATHQRRLGCGSVELSTGADVRVQACRAARARVARVADLCVALGHMQATQREGMYRLCS